MKLDEEGNKRKLSKRKDPELSLDYYRREGYHPAAVREYLLTILNSNFEEWRIANPDVPIDDFAFTTEKMSNSGALFDFLKAWAEEFKQELLHIFEDHAYLEKSSTSDATRSATRGKTTSMRSRSSVKSARAQDCQNFYKLFARRRVLQTA